MSIIVTRAGKGTPLTYNEVDTNFTNLNAQKMDDAAKTSITGFIVSSSTTSVVNTISSMTGLSIGMNVQATSGAGSFGANSYITAIDYVASTITVVGTSAHTSGSTTFTAYPSIDQLVVNTAIVPPTSGGAVAGLTVTGNTGLNTTSPMLRIVQTGAGNALQIEDDNTNPDATLFKIDPAGNVGIGVAYNTTLVTGLQLGTLGFTPASPTASPLGVFASTNPGTTNALMIQNKSNASSSLTQFQVINSDGSSITKYGAFGINSPSEAGTLGTTSVTTSNIVYLKTIDSDLVLTTIGANSIRFVASQLTVPADRLAIASTGTGVVLGTTAPSAWLHIGAGTATAGQAPIKLNPGVILTSGNTTSAEQGVFEFDSTSGSNALYFTNAASTGRAVIPTVQLYKLIADSTAVTATSFTGSGTNPFTNIANTTVGAANIPVSGGGVYEVELFFIYSALVVTGARNFQLNFDVAPTRYNIEYEASPITGVVAPSAAAATMLRGHTYGQTAASFTATTGSLSLTTGSGATTAAFHTMRMKLFLVCGGSTSKITISAWSPATGTLTLLAGSYWKATRLPTTNTSTIVA
jgi:hypothetical protein